MLQSLLAISHNSIFLLLYLFSLCNTIMLLTLFFNTTLFYTIACHMCESVHVQNVVISRKNVAFDVCFLSCSRFNFSALQTTAFSWVRFSPFLIKMSTEKICRHQLYSYVNVLSFFSFEETQVCCLYFPSFTLTHFIFLYEKLNV